MFGKEARNAAGIAREKAINGAGSATLVLRFTLAASRLSGQVNGESRRRDSVYGTAAQMASCLKVRAIAEWVTPQGGGHADHHMSVLLSPGRAVRPLEGHLRAWRTNALHGASGGLVPRHARSGVASRGTGGAK